MEKASYYKIYNEAFNDELEKIALNPDEPAIYKRKYIPLKKSFMAGLDPTGTRTFSIGQRAERHGKHKAVGVAGGLVGGLALIPSSVSGATGAIKGFAGAKGGIGSRALGGIKGFATGAVRPYKDLYHGVKATKGLARSKQTGVVDAETMEHIRKAMRVGKKSKGVKSSKFYNMIPNLKGNGGVDAVHGMMSDKTKNIMSGLGASGVIGAGSSYLQYNQGRRVGDKEIGLRKRLTKVTSSRNIS